MEGWLPASYESLQLQALQLFQSAQYNPLLKKYFKKRFFLFEYSASMNSKNSQ